MAQAAAAIIMSLRVEVAQGLGPGPLRAEQVSIVAVSLRAAGASGRPASG